MNVYVVLAGRLPVVFVNDADAEQYADYSGNGPVLEVALRNHEDAQEMLADWADTFRKDQM